MNAILEAAADALRRTLIGAEGDPDVTRSALVIYFNIGLESGETLETLTDRLLRGRDAVCRRAMMGNPQMIQIIDLVKSIRFNGRECS